jgi:negative regulator of sigma E activity
MHSFNQPPGSSRIIGKPTAKTQYFTRSQGRVMGTYEDIQNQTAEQTLREELQLVRKENEELASQVRALLAQLQSSQQYPTLPLSFSPRGQEPGSTSNEPTPVPPPPPPRASQESHQYVTQPPTIQAPPVNAPINLTIPVTPTVATAQQTPIDKHSVEQMEYILSKLRVLEGSQGTIDPS